MTTRSRPSPVKTVEVVLTGEMRYEATTGSGHLVRVDNREGDSAPRPTELVLVGLATCTAMDVISICRKKRQDVERYRVHVRATQRREYPQVFTRIDLVHELEGKALSEEAVRRSVELSAVKYCPVSAMLSAGDTEIHHAYRILDPGRPDPSADVEVVVTGPRRPTEIVE